MHFHDLVHLAHLNFSGFRTRSLASIIVIGILFGFILGAELIIQGLENVTLCYAGEPTSNVIYLASDYDNGRRPELIRERASYYGGELREVNPDDLDSLGFIPQYMVVFRNYAQTYEYYRLADDQQFNYSPQHYNNTELYTNQMSVYDYFYRLKHHLRPLVIVLMIAAILILTFTTAHLIAESGQSITLYRSLGASRWQIFAIYLAYLLELCLYAALFAIIIALLLAGLATGISWQYLQTTLTEFYPLASTHLPILLGVNWSYFGIIAAMFLAAPGAFLLSIDQFSSKKIALRLKEN